ncbi:MAG: hypothetical protein CMO81_05820, partial [Waddliaceae bacterium]|nr:hypothetical protein [Waddliaceae bacterium]
PGVNPPPQAQLPGGPGINPPPQAPVPRGPGVNPPPQAPVPRGPGNNPPQQAPAQVNPPVQAVNPIINNLNGLLPPPVPANRVPMISAPGSGPDVAQKDLQAKKPKPTIDQLVDETDIGKIGPYFTHVPQKSIDWWRDLEEKFYSFSDTLRGNISANKILDLTPIGASDELDSVEKARWRKGPILDDKKFSPSDLAELSKKSPDQRKEASRLFGHWRRASRTKKYLVHLEEAISFLCNFGKYVETNVVLPEWGKGDWQIRKKGSPLQHAIRDFEQVALSTNHSRVRILAEFGRAFAYEISAGQQMDYQSSVALFTGLDKKNFKIAEECLVFAAKQYREVYRKIDAEVQAFENHLKTRQIAYANEQKNRYKVTKVASWLIKTMTFDTLWRPHAMTDERTEKEIETVKKQLANLKSMRDECYAGFSRVAANLKHKESDLQAPKARLFLLEQSAKEDPDRWFEVAEMHYKDRAYGDAEKAAQTALNIVFSDRSKKPKNDPEKIQHFQQKSAKLAKADRLLGEAVALLVAAEKMSDKTGLGFGRSVYKAADSVDTAIELILAAKLQNMQNGEEEKLGLDVLFQAMARACNNLFVHQNHKDLGYFADQYSQLALQARSGNAIVLPSEGEEDTDPMAGRFGPPPRGPQRGNGAPSHSPEWLKDSPYKHIANVWKKLTLERYPLAGTVADNAMREGGRFQLVEQFENRFDRNGRPSMGNQNGNALVIR